jgi:hypothetical protein
MIMLDRAGAAPLTALSGGLMPHEAGRSPDFHHGFMGARIFPLVPAEPVPERGMPW